MTDWDQVVDDIVGALTAVLIAIVGIYAVATVAADLLPDLGFISGAIVGSLATAFTLFAYQQVKGGMRQTEGRGGRLRER